MRMKKGVPLLIAGILLIIFWLLAVYSVSIFESFTTTLGSDDFEEPTNYFYFMKQIKALGIALFAVLVLRKLPLINLLKSHKFASFCMLFALWFQLLVFTPFFKPATDDGTFNGANGWLIFPWFGSVQPVEIFKLAYVLFLSSWLIRRKDEINKPWFIGFFIFICALLYAGLLFVPDLWSVLIMGGTALLMVRFSWLSIKKTFTILLLWLFAWVFAWFSMYLINPKYNYIQKRFANFFSSDKKENQQTEQWQNEQALMAIWWWWFFGQGLGKGLQKFWNVPEAQSDFIFAAFSEEIWFFWNMILLGLYVFIFWYSLRCLQDLKDPHLKMIWIGILSILMVQTFVHIWVNIQIVPNTWVTLPFVSSWGTSILISCIELFLLYKIIISEWQPVESLFWKKENEKLWK